MNLRVSKSGQLRLPGSFVILHLPHHFGRDRPAAKPHRRESGNRVIDNAADVLSLCRRVQRSAHQVNDHLTQGHALVVRQLSGNGVQISWQIDRCSHRLHLDALMRLASYCSAS